MSAAADPGLTQARALAAQISASLGTTFDDFAPLGQGQGARVYAFRCQNQAWVLRLASEPRHVASERQAHRLFGARLAVPTVRLEGKWQGLHWAIVSRCRGQSLDQLSAEALAALAPDLLLIHQNLILSPIPSMMFPYVAQWQAYLAEYTQSPFILSQVSNPYGWLDARLIIQAIEALNLKLAYYPPHPVWFCHGDFKPSNLCAEAQHITGIFDWSELNVTDYLYDPACWLLQLPAANWPSWQTAFKQLHERLGLDTRFWQERLQACMLRKVITTLLHASRTAQASEFTLAQQQLAHLMTMP